MLAFAEPMEVQITQAQRVPIEWEAKPSTQREPKTLHPVEPPGYFDG
jgi:hypothetical protein